MEIALARFGHDDAVLLAERVFLPLALLHRALHHKDHWPALHNTVQEYIASWQLDWEQFSQEYPWVKGGLEAWTTRLANALAPTFAGCNQPMESKVLTPEWRTSDVLGIARGIRHERAYDRLPILADALKEAGCVDAEILTHCRAAEKHNSGCWIVDWLLGSGTT